MGLLVAPVKVVPFQYDLSPFILIPNTVQSTTKDQG